MRGKYQTPSCSSSLSMCYYLCYYFFPAFAAQSEPEAPSSAETLCSVKPCWPQESPLDVFSASFSSLSPINASMGLIWAIAEATVESPEDVVLRGFDKCKVLAKCRLQKGEVLNKDKHCIKSVGLIFFIDFSSFPRLD